MLRAAALVAPLPLSLDAVAIDTTAALFREIDDENGARDLHLRRGTYVVDRTLVLPDGVTLRGDGVMRYEDKLRLQGLVLQGAEDHGSAQGGNVIAVVSRRPNDRIEGEIVECEIDNANPLGFTDAGPKGYGVVVVTHNVRGTPHVGALVRLRMEKSIVRPEPRRRVVRDQLRRQGHDRSDVAPQPYGSTTLRHGGGQPTGPRVRPHRRGRPRCSSRRGAAHSGQDGPPFGQHRRPAAQAPRHRYVTTRRRGPRIARHAIGARARRKCCAGRCRRAQHATDSHARGYRQQSRQRRLLHVARVERRVRLTRRHVRTAAPIRA